MSMVQPLTRKFVNYLGECCSLKRSLLLQQTRSLPISFLCSPRILAAIATKKLNTGVKDADGKFQQLELRWDGCQSVLPPSVHPETNFYRWRKSPEEVAIAQAPMWLIEQMLDEPASEVQRLDDIQLPVDGVVPLTVCLTRRSRDMLSTGLRLLIRHGMIQELS
jgi:hypothetical protein